MTTVPLLLYILGFHLRRGASYRDLKNRGKGTPAELRVYKGLLSRLENGSLSDEE